MKTMARVMVSLFLMSGLAFAKVQYNNHLGIKACTDCHVAGKLKEANPTNKLWAKAKEHAGKLEKAKGDFAGKRSCADCHKGHQKPAK